MYSRRSWLGECVVATVCCVVCVIEYGWYVGRGYCGVCGWKDRCRDGNALSRESHLVWLVFCGSHICDLGLWTSPRRDCRTSRDIPGCEGTFGTWDSGHVLGGTCRTSRDIWDLGLWTSPSRDM